MKQVKEVGFWTLILTLIGGAFYFGQSFGSNKFDQIKIDLSNDNQKLKARLEKLGETSDNSQTLVSISGTVFKDQDSTHSLNNVEIYLIPASGNNEIMTVADDKGEFNFPKIQDRNWWIIIRNLNTEEKSSARYLLKSSTNFGKLNLSGANLHYKIKSEK